MKWLKSDVVLALLIYLVGLGITLNYAINKQVISSDQSAEFGLYIQSIQQGGWRYVLNDTINSCLVVTTVPAYIQRFTHIDAVLLFKVYSCFFISLIPAFIYLISRPYMNKVYAILASCLMLSNFYFLYYPAIGRVGVAVGFLTVMVWGILNKRYLVVGICGMLIIFSHYGTIVIGVGLLGISWLYYLARLKFKFDFRWLSGILVVLIVIGIVWYWFIANPTGFEMVNFVVRGGETLGLRESPDNAVVAQSHLYTLNSREAVIQTAFGQTWDVMNIPQKIEWGLSWIIALSITGGLIYVLWKRLLTIEHRLLAIGGYGLIVITVIVPYLSVYYGVMRVYFTVLVVLAPIFVIGIRDLSAKFKVRGEYVIIGILLPYALCVSGIMHLWFGIVK